MKPYTATIKDPENLRKNWRGNRLSKGRNGDPGGKGRFTEKVGNSNYWRKVADRPFKKRARQSFKRAIHDYFRFEND